MTKAICRMPSRFAGAGQGPRLVGGRRNTLRISAFIRRRFEMTGGSGVIIRRPSVAESLRILLGEADCDGALGVVEMALSPGASGPPLHLHPTHAEAFSTCSPGNCPCR